MAGLSRYLHRELLDHVFGVGSYTPPSIYVALFTVAPDSQGAGGTEVTGGSYARKLHAAWNAATDADPAVVTNDGEILFAEATASWGAVVAVGIYDALTAGNFLGFGAVSKTIASGDQARFQDGELEIQLGPAS